MSDNQQLFNIVVGVCGALGGWSMKVMWDTLRDLQKSDKQLAEKLSNIEVIVAGDYVKREELAKITETLFNKLDRIEEKLDKKVDK
jgi:hypothetical protein